MPQLIRILNPLYNKIRCGGGEKILTTSYGRSDSAGSGIIREHLRTWSIGLPKSQIYIIPCCANQGSPDGFTVRPIVLELILETDTVRIQADDLWLEQQGEDDHQISSYSSTLM